MDILTKYIQIKLIFIVKIIELFNKHAQVAMDSPGITKAHHKHVCVFSPAR